MRPARLSALALLLTTCLSNVPFARSANVCLLLYLLADNNLEEPIRGDLEEFVSSPLIKSQSLTSWVYFDHRNFFFSSSENIYDRLPFVYNKDGSERSGDKPEGSFYFRYDHGLGKLIIEEDLGELNSDSPQTVEDFVDRGLADCISRGSEEFMIVFGSHGGGFLGFGGDENIRRNNRALVQENNLIVGAMRSALDKNLGPGSKFDIVGFDACLMQALGAADDYKSVAKYLLASEEVEPGHGWDYTNAPQSISGSALDIAKYFQRTFLTSLHGDFQHETPKTLSIVDLQEFETSFLVKWEALSREWVTLMQANDPEVAIMLGRARTTAHDFQCASDEVEKSCVDMLDFMNAFKRLCPVGQDIPLGNALQEAMSAYEHMFVAKGIGPGTPSSLTGMHVFFPTKAGYREQSEYLFGNPSFATTVAPEWLRFLKTFYRIGTPSSDGTSVCGSSSTPISSTPISATPDTAPANALLLINPTVSDFREGVHQIDMEVARSVSSVLIEYGTEVTSLFGRRQRRLSAMRNTNSVAAKGDMAKSHRRYDRRGRGRNDNHQEKRRVEEEFDFVYLFSGDVLGEYEGSKYSATWDRSFWTIRSPTQSNEAIYVYDMSEGSKEAEVVYFPPSTDVTEEDLSFMTSIEEALDMGAQYGYLSFSETNANNIGIVTTVTLYTDSGDGRSYSEVPLSAGGRVVPIARCEGTWNGIEIEYLIGGFDFSIFDWDPNTSIEMQKVDAVVIADLIDATFYGIDITAGDENTGRYSSVILDFGRDGRLIPNDIIVEDDFVGDDYDDDNFFDDGWFSGSFDDDWFTGSFDDDWFSGSSERFTTGTGLLVTLFLYFIW